MGLILKGKRLILRPPKLSEAPILEKYINDRLVSRWLSNVPYPYPRGGYKKWTIKSLKESKNKKRFNFTIHLNKKPIGSIGLSKIDWENKKAMLGYWLARKYWGQGIMTESVRLVLDFAFNKLKLNRIESFHLKQNKASERVQEKCGLRKEGINRQAVLKDGKFHHLVCRAILAKDYKKLKKKWNAEKL